MPFPGIVVRLRKAFHPSIFLHHALLGNLSTDRKNGAQSARVRNSGTITMQFDLTGGPTSVTVKHAVFGSDGSSNQINFDDFTVNGSGSGSTGGGKKFLFDATKAETAGNADWVIDEDGGTPQRTPTPAQSSITTSTSETFWTGAISSWGIALVKAGNTVETLPSGASITVSDRNNDGHGSQGNVSQLEFNNGATITVNPSANSTVQGLIWQSGFTQNTTHIMCASSTFGTGRVFVVTDSSPMDDGKGASGNNLFVSWPILSHTQLFMNASLWLAELQ